MLNSVEVKPISPWRTKFPTAIGALLSIAQMIFTIGILGCEIAGDIVDFPRMNIFMGYWTLPFFMCAWISLASASCCCRIRCCGIATLAFQCLAIPNALFIVGFDSYFLVNPTPCFFSSCTSYSSYYGSVANTYDTTSLYNIKVPLVTGQLAAAAAMFISCIIYIIIFTVTSYRVKQVSPLQNGSLAPATMTHPPVQYVPSDMKPTYDYPRNENPMNQYPALPPVAPPRYAPSAPPISAPSTWDPVICPVCRNMFQINSIHRY